jgi:hypothetical protein
VQRTSLLSYDPLRGADPARRLVETHADWLAHGLAWPARWGAQARAPADQLNCAPSRGADGEYGGGARPRKCVERACARPSDARRADRARANSIPGFRCRPKGRSTPSNTSATGLSSKKLESLLLENGVSCLSGTSFGALGEGFLRFSYANSEANILEGMQRVRTSLQPA